MRHQGLTLRAGMAEPHEQVSLHPAASMLPLAPSLTRVRVTHANLTILRMTDTGLHMTVNKSDLPVLQ